MTSRPPRTTNSREARTSNESIARERSGKRNDIMGSMNMDGMGWMAGEMGLIGVLTVVVLVLAIAALVKYPFFANRRDNKRAE